MDNIKTYTEAAAAIRNDETAEKLCAMGMLPIEVLVKIATGEINAQALAAAYVAARGLGKDGKWVGFYNADKFWSGK